MDECLDTWAVVEEQKALNKYPRINWKGILGMSLTRAVARFKAAGMTAEQTIAGIEYEHKDLTEEAKKRLKIGVCARFGEMATADSERVKVKDLGGKQNGQEINRNR